VIITQRVVRLRTLSGIGIALMGLWAAQSARGDASATANSNNWCFYKWFDSSRDTTTYYSATNALAGTYNSTVQAWNEGGTDGPFSSGSQPKFMNVGGVPTGYSYPSQYAAVPTPGTTNASASVIGDSKAVAGTVWGTNYEVSGLPFCFVKQATVPAGGFGKGVATWTDPSEIDLPNPSGPNDTFDLHVFFDLGGSSMEADPVANGTSHAEIDWHLDLQGAGSSYASDLFDYDASSSGSGGFSSTLLTASGVQFYLNDESGSVEFDPSTAVTPSQLKAYLDGFETSNGWSPGSSEMLVEMDVPIDDSAVGVGDDPSMREFLMDDDVSAEADASLAPEPGALAIIAGVGLTGMLRRRGRA
jgi:hypothetical protein